MLYRSLHSAKNLHTGKAWPIGDLFFAIARWSTILIRKNDRKVIAIAKSEDRDLAIFSLNKTENNSVQNQG